MLIIIIISGKEPTCQCRLGVRDTGSIPGLEDPLEKGMAIHFSILAWEIPRTEEPVGNSLWSRKESDMTEHTHTLCFLNKIKH